MEFKLHGVVLNGVIHIYMYLEIERAVKNIQRIILLVSVRNDSETKKCEK